MGEQRTNLLPGNMLAFFLAMIVLYVAKEVSAVLGKLCFNFYTFLFSMLQEYNYSSVAFGPLRTDWDRSWSLQPRKRQILALVPI